MQRGIQRSSSHIQHNKAIYWMKEGMLTQDLRFAQMTKTRRVIFFLPCSYFLPHNLKIVFIQ